MANLHVFDLLLSYQLLRERGEDDLCPGFQVQHKEHQYQRLSQQHRFI